MNRPELGIALPRNAVAAAVGRTAPGTPNVVRSGLVCTPAEPPPERLIRDFSEAVGGAIQV